VVPEFEAIDGILIQLWHDSMPSTTRASLFINALLLSWRYPDPIHGRTCLHAFQNIDQGTVTSTISINGMKWAIATGSAHVRAERRVVSTWHPVRTLAFASVVTLAAEDLYTAVFDTSA